MFVGASAYRMLVVVFRETFAETGGESRSSLWFRAEDVHLLLYIQYRSALHVCMINNAPENYPSLVNRCCTLHFAEI